MLEGRIRAEAGMVPWGQVGVCIVLQVCIERGGLAKVFFACLLIGLGFRGNFL